MTRRIALFGLLLALLAWSAHADEPNAAPPAPVPEAPKPADGASADEVELARSTSRLAALLEEGDALGAVAERARIAALLAKLERYDEAFVRYGEVVDAWRALKRPRDVSVALHARGRLEERLQRFAEAEASYVAGLEALEAANEPAAEAFLLLELSRLRRSTGKAAGALDAARAALEIQADRSDPRAEARARASVGSCLFCLGRYAEALEAHVRALEVFRDHKDDVRIAFALARLGNVNLRIGSLEEARMHYEEALERFRELKDLRNVAVTLSNLGIVHEMEGDLELAGARYGEALGIYAGGSDRRRLAGMLAAAGIVDMRRERYDEALAKERRAFDLFEALDDRLGRARALVNVANIQERQGLLDEAHVACDQAEAILGADAPPAARAAVMWTRSRVYLAAKQSDGAWREARRAIDLVSRLSQGLADTEEAATREVYDGLFDVCIDAAVALDDVEDLTWALEQSRAVVLRDGLAARCALAAADIPASLCTEAAEAQAALRDATAAWQEAEADGNLAGIRATQETYDAAKATFQRVMLRVERKSKAAADLLNTEPYELARMQAEVQPQEALVLYGLAHEVAVALIVRRDAVRTVRLGSGAQILEAVEAVCAGDRTRTLAEADAATATLRALLAAPLKLPGDVRRVLVSPVGVLGFVPFCLLFPERDVAYMPSGTTYGQLRGGGARRGHGVLALGAPEYEGDRLYPAVRTRKGNRFELLDLPATRDEVEDIGTTVLVGKAASEAGLAAALGDEDRWLAVHFACHGYVDPERPMLSCLALSADDGNDGFLTCHEILQLKIPADLVVLSACETGRGRVYRTEGIVGLTRAFLFAGADRVLCSLWKAHDEATQALMTRFYELWNPDEGEALGAAAALRGAQAFVRDHPEHPEWEHPFYWAAWVLWGLPD